MDFRIVTLHVLQSKLREAPEYARLRVENAIMHHERREEMERMKTTLEEIFAGLRDHPPERTDTADLEADTLDLVVDRVQSGVDDPSGST